MTDPTHQPGRGEGPDPAGEHDSNSWGTTMESSRRRFLALAGLTAGGAAVGIGAAGCGTAQTGNRPGGTESKGRPGTSGETFFVAGFQWGPPTNFNPLGPSPAWPSTGGQIQLIYETLLRFNMLDGSLQPGLGKELVEVDAQTLEVPLQDGTKWHDGSDLTADDVVFTFELAKDNSLSYSNVWEYLESVTAKDPRTVQFKAKSKPLNLLPVRNAIAGTVIIPKAVWSKIDAKKLTSDTNMEPVGSGPFKLEKADQTQISLIRFDDYWGKALYGTPAMKMINHPIFRSNNDGDLKLESGEIDASQQFTAQIWKMWEKGRPVGTWLKQKPYYLPGNTPLLQINNKVKGLDNPMVRRAIAFAIDTPNIAKTAMSDYSDPANASLILPTGYEEKFYDQAAVDAQGWKYDPEEAVRILEEDLKATKGSDGIYKLPDGTRLGPWTVITPTGWSDWQTACEVAAKSLKAVGIDVATEFPQAPQVTSKMQNGDFELACWSASGVSLASPWSRFRDLMDNRGAAGLGKTTFYNFVRFSDPEVPGLLDQAGAAGSDEERREVYQKLDAIFREKVPAVPLMYRPLEFYEFNETNWVGFPTAENPFAPPMWQGAGIQWLFKLKKVGT